MYGNGTGCSIKNLLYKIKIGREIIEIEFVIYCDIERCDVCVVQVIKIKYKDLYEKLSFWTQILLLYVNQS